MIVGRSTDDMTVMGRAAGVLHGELQGRSPAEDRNTQYPAQLPFGVRKRFPVDLFAAFRMMTRLSAFLLLAERQLCQDLSQLPGLNAPRLR